MTSLPATGCKWLAGGTITVLVRTKDKSLIKENKATEHTEITNHVRWMEHRSGCTKPETETEEGKEEKEMGKEYYLKKAKFKGGSSYEEIETNYKNKKHFDNAFKPSCKIFRFNKGEYVFVLQTTGILCYKRGKF